MIMPPSKQPTEETPYRPDYIARWEGDFMAGLGFSLSMRNPEETEPAVWRWMSGNAGMTQATRPNRLGQIFVDIAHAGGIRPGRYLVRQSTLGPWAVRVDDVPTPPEPSPDLGPTHDHRSKGLVSHVVQLLDPEAPATLIGDLFVSVAISTGWRVVNVRNDKPPTVYTRLICTRSPGPGAWGVFIDVHCDGTITANVGKDDATDAIDRVLRVLKS